MAHNNNFFYLVNNCIRLGKPMIIYKFTPRIHMYFPYKTTETDLLHLTSPDYPFCS